MCKLNQFQLLISLGKRVRPFAKLYYYSVRPSGLVTRSAASLVTSRLPAVSPGKRNVLSSSCIQTTRGCGRPLRKVQKGMLSTTDKGWLKGQVWQFYGCCEAVFCPCRVENQLYDNQRIAKHIPFAMLCNSVNR